MPYLAKDIISPVTRECRGSRGDEVDVVSVSGHVLIVEHAINKVRFAIIKEEISDDKPDNINTPRVEPDPPKPTRQRPARSQRNGQAGNDQKAPPEQISLW